MDKKNGITMVSDMERAEEMVQTTLKKWILLLGLTMSTFGFGDTVLERKVLSDSGGINCSDIMWVKMFLTQQSNKPFILVLAGGNTPYRLYTANSVIEVKEEYGVYVGGYVKNGQLILAFWNIGENVVFYDVQKGFSPTLSVKMQRQAFQGIIADPQEDGKFYIPYWSNVGSSNPLAMLAHILSGGHGICYAKPFLVEIKEGKLLRDYEINYDGRRNESYHIEDAVGGAKMIHFLGFRDGTQRKNGVEVPMLYYAGYSTEEKKVVQSYDIFEKEKIGLNHFGPLSMVCKKNDVFIVFPWVIESQESILSDNIGKAISDIYYFQYCSKAASKTVQIAKGFQPSVRLDSKGKVYIFWLDYGGNLVCKTKQGNTWSKDKIILTGIDMVLSGIAVEFDSEDNLHLVYLSKGSLIYEKRKLSEN